MAWLYRRPDSKSWWIGYRLNGRQYLRSTEKNRRTDAEKVLAQFNSMAEAHRADSLTQEFYDALTNKPSVRLVLQVAMLDWLNECKGANAPDTHARYNDVVQAFLIFLKADDRSPALHDITPADVQGFLDSIRAHRSAATTNLYRRILSAFFLRSVKRQLLKSNPLWPIRKYKAGRWERTERRPYTMDEINVMFLKAPSDFWRFMIMAGFFTGLRMGDLICLTWANHDISANMLRLKSAKTGQTLNIPLAPRLAAFLPELRSKAGRVKGTDFLWPEQAARYLDEGAGPFSNAFYDEILLPSGLVPKRTKKAYRGIGRAAERTSNQISFHSLRHTFISFLRIAGVNQSVTKELAGHSTDQVNQIYTHVPESALAEAVALLPDITMQEDESQKPIK